MFGELAVGVLADLLVPLLRIDKDARVFLGDEGQCIKLTNTVFMLFSFTMFYLNVWVKAAVYNGNGLFQVDYECCQRLGRAGIIQLLPFGFDSLERLAVFRFACAPITDGGYFACELVQVDN